MSTAALLLAAGLSRRFGAEDKLLAQLGGKPLIRHAADAVSECPVERRIAVVSSPMVTPHLVGFDIVSVKDAASALSHSLRSGLVQAQKHGATRVLVVLGDMPFVTSEHLKKVLDRAAAHGASATISGAAKLPPACFLAPHFPALSSAEGDTGARALIQSLPREALVECPADSALDIDTQQQLRAAHSVNAGAAPR